MAFHDDGSILVGNVLSGRRISRLDLSTGGVSTYVDFHRGVFGADDITSDGEGTCWTSCATGLGGESVFRIEKSGRARAIYSGIAGANGIQFNRKTGRLFVGQFLAGSGLYEIDPLGKAPARLITKAFASTNAMDSGRPATGCSRRACVIPLSSNSILAMAASPCAIFRPWGRQGSRPWRQAPESCTSMTACRCADSIARLIRWYLPREASSPAMGFRCLAVCGEGRAARCI
jgi:hypothetical protein